MKCFNESAWFVTAPAYVAKVSKQLAITPQEMLTTRHSLYTCLFVYAKVLLFGDLRAVDSSIKHTISVLRCPKMSQLWIQAVDSRIRHKISVLRRPKKFQRTISKNPTMQQ